MTQPDDAEWHEVARPPTTARFADIAGKSVLITGGGSGIGAAIVEGFVAQGARVAFLDLVDADGWCDQLHQKYATRPIFHRCDMTDTDAVKTAIAAISAQNGPVEVLVNSAANDQRHETLEVDDAFWNWSLDINLKSYFFTAQTVLGPMQAAGTGAIINFSSISYMMGMAGFPCYAAANAGIVSLTHSLAREFGPSGVRVNAIAPGVVLTPRQKKLWLTPQLVQEHLQNQCLPAPLVPTDLVGPVLFLASDASAMMTSQTLIVDGGMVVRN